jgi:bifunctional non-homologous end joining protein LigD
MLAKLADLPADGSDWGFEYKWDGVRCIAYCDAAGVRFESRNGNDITARYPELHATAERLRRRGVVLDGEIVALDDASRPSFSLLQGRMHLAHPGAVQRAIDTIPIVYLVFDVLAIDGRVVMDLPYTERRAILEAIEFDDERWQAPGWLAGDGKRMLTFARSAGYEGIVAKRLDSRYAPGERNGAWLKIKVRHRQEFVVAGYLPGSGRFSDRVGSLLLGYYVQKRRGSSQPELHYAGNVGTGMSELERTVLKRELDAIRRATSPFAGPAPAGGRRGAAVFAEPELVAEISYAELTPGGLLRHPVYHGLRIDKDAREVVLETK